MQYTRLVVLVAQSGRVPNFLESINLLASWNFSVLQPSAPQQQQVHPHHHQPQLHPHQPHQQPHHVTNHYYGQNNPVGGHATLTNSNYQQQFPFQSMQPCTFGPGSVATNHLHFQGPPGNVTNVPNSQPPGPHASTPNQNGRTARGQNLLASSIPLGGDGLGIARGSDEAPAR
jgi:hypothetical protein